MVNKLVLYLYRFFSTITHKTKIELSETELPTSNEEEEYPLESLNVKALLLKQQSQHCGRNGVMVSEPDYHPVDRGTLPFSA